MLETKYGNTQAYFECSELTLRVNLLTSIASQLPNCPAHLILTSAIAYMRKKLLEFSTNVCKINLNYIKINLQRKVCISNLVLVLVLFCILCATNLALWLQYFNKLTYLLT